ncbi:MAG: hemerythrin domain-containing protein [Arcobacteraceae bacterium]
MNNGVVLNWDDVYSVGHEKVDSEHQKLFELAKVVSHCSDDKEQIMSAVKELIKYTKFHFANEEIYMKSVNFIYLDEHKLLHKNLINTINTLLKNINSLSTDEIQNQLSEIINKNIINHILTEDKRVHHYRRSANELKNLFCWKEKYQLFHYDIDMEHKQLFDIAIKALNGNKGDIKLHIKSTVTELYEYMKTHFEHEEEYMQSINYEGYEEHKLLHEDIITQLNDFLKKLPTLSIENFERSLIEYMDVWLINHIITEDQKIINSQY